MLRRRNPSEVRLKRRAFAKYAMDQKRESQFNNLAGKAALLMLAAPNRRSRRFFFVIACICLARVEEINTVVHEI